MCDDAASARVAADTSGFTVGEALRALYVRAEGTVVLASERFVSRRQTHPCGAAVLGMCYHSQSYKSQSAVVALHHLHHRPAQGGRWDDCLPGPCSHLWRCAWRVSCVRGCCATR
eukprot:COSAG01_NODE_6905_length_3444_cov_19.912108_6_plen_115_part_00